MASKGKSSLAVVLATLFAVIVLVGCVDAARPPAASTAGSQASSSASHSAAAPSSGAASSSASASQPKLKEPEVDLDELAQGLLYKGLPEKYVDMSWLGVHDEAESDGKATHYRWRSKNGLNDSVYGATCEKGVVVRVYKYYSASGYWPELFGLPDLYAVDPFAKQEEPGNKYSPRDYDSAEDWEADTGGSIEEWDRHE